MKGRCRRRSATELRILRALAMPSLAYSSLHQMASLPRPARAAVMPLFLRRVIGSSFRSAAISNLIHPVSRRRPWSDSVIPAKAGIQRCVGSSWLLVVKPFLTPSRPSPVKGEGVLQRSPKREASHWHNGGYGRSTAHASTGSARTVEGYLCTNGEGTPVHERWRVTCARMGKGHLCTNGGGLLVHVREGTPEHVRGRDTCACTGKGHLSMYGEGTPVHVRGRDT